jgi:hypothetical protein
MPLKSDVTFDLVGTSKLSSSDRFPSDHFGLNVTVKL